MLTGDWRCGMLALVRVRAAATADAPAVSAPLIERMFRCTWFLATEKRGEMLREGRGDEVDKLVAEAHAFQKSLRGDAAD